MIVSSIAEMSVSTFLSFRGHTCMYPEKRSTASSAALFPLSVCGMFGIKSMAHVTLGART